MPLSPGKPDPTVVDRLETAMLERLFGSAIITDRTSARLCVAGLWLLYDHLDECHEISQSIETPDGSYWHAIMHRREGDFSNSKYWYRRVGNHPILPALRERAKALGWNNPAGDRDVSTEWDPFVFVDRCEKAVRGSLDLEQICRIVQQAEWQLLFDHCFKKSTGKV